MLNFIWTLIKDGRITPATGRLLEVGILTALASAAAYAADAATGGGIADWKAILSVAATAFLAYITKAQRDAAK